MKPASSNTSNSSEGHGSQVRFVTLVGFLVNLGLSVIKFLAGIYGNSQALVADAVHSLSDMVTDLVVIIGSYYWTKPADHHHHYGHGRIETLVSIAVGALLCLAGVGLINEALQTMSAGATKAPGKIAVVAAVISIFANEFLFRYSFRVGKRLKSSALVANAWHHRSDAFSSVPALLAVVGAIFVPEWGFLDRVGAIVVSVFIFQAAYKIICPALKELTDASATPEVCNEIVNIAAAVDGVREVHGLRTRLTGASLYADLHVLVESTMTVKAGHDIAEEVQARLLAADLDVVDVVVHIEPA